MATLLFCVSLYLHLHRVHFTSSYFFYYRQNAAKWQTAGIKFTHRPKISIFAPQWRLIAPIHGKFGMTRGHMGPLGHTKFHANQFTGIGTRPQNVKFGMTRVHMGPLGHTKFHANQFTGVGTRPPKWQKFPLFGRVAPQG